MKVFGIDISYYQKGINLSKAKNEGVEFVIIRGGFTGSSNKSLSKDSQFETHYKNAKSNGLGVGVYHFSRACSFEEGTKEANFLYEKCLKGKTFEFPIYIDVEDTKYQAKAGKNAVTEAIKGFCETLENKGYYVGIYASSSWFKNYMNLDKLTMYDKWVAQWSKTRPTSIEHGLWQFGGETNKIRTNKVAGVVCDQNYAYKDYPIIMKNACLNGFLSKKEESTPITPTEPKKSLEQVANEVIEGKWGNGEERKTKLTEAGYNYDEVQAKVNEKSRQIIHTVQKGEYLSKIAKKYGVKWTDIAKKNNIKFPYIIKVGQKLIIK